MGSNSSIFSRLGQWRSPSKSTWQQYRQPFQSFIEVQNLSKDFAEGTSQRRVLDNLSIAFDEGSFIVLLGQSGSGKSTLLNLLSGIERSTSGSILIDGIPITELDERACTLFRRDQIGFIFQFFNLIPTLTVLENVTLPQELAGKSPQEIESQGRSLLEKVGLGDRADSFPDKLSGGQQQRVAIARALVHEPQLILADEPTGNLDEETGATVLQLLLDLTRNASKTLIMATHNPEIARYADRILKVQDGHLDDATQEFAPTPAQPSSQPSGKPSGHDSTSGLKRDHGEVATR